MCALSVYRKVCEPTSEPVAMRWADDGDLHEFGSVRARRRYCLDGYMLDTFGSRRQPPSHHVTRSKTWQTGGRTPMLAEKAARFQEQDVRLGDPDGGMKVVR